jgi:hypothetical protein
MTEILNTVISFTLNLCRISRRGKAAKGHVTVHTFGIPVLNPDGIAKDWDYTPFANGNMSDAIDAVRSLGINPVIALLQGADLVNKSDSMRKQNQLGLLTARVLEMGLAPDTSAAAKIADAILETIRLQLKAGMDPDDIPTVEFMLESKRKRLAKTNANLPRLVDNRNIIPVDEIGDIESDDDSDDELSDDEDNDESDSDDSDSDEDNRL